MSHMRLFSIFLFLLPIILSCKGYDSYEYLNGDFIARGSQLPATLVNPTNNGNISVATQFLWTPAGDASSYRIEISTNADVSSPILKAIIKSAQYTIQSADLIGVSSLPEQSYYWRVVTVYPTKEEISSVFKFVLYDKDIIYVDVGSAAATELGNLTAPFKTIQAAINFALANGRTKVYVSKGIYNGAIVLGLGTTLQGGYDAAAGWGRNIVLNTTTIRTATGIITVTSPSGATSSTVLDGFTIQNNLSTGSSFAIYNNTSSPLISNNIITGGSGSTNYAIYNTSNSSPTVSNNVITGGSGPSVIGAKNIAIENQLSSSPTIMQNTISGGISSGDIGIENSGSSSPIISNNAISAGTGGGYAISNSTSSSPNIYNNTIKGGSGVNNAGIYSGDASSVPVITNNTIDGGSSGFAQAILLSSTGTIINNNILFCSGGTSQYGIYEIAGFVGTATSVKNNNLFGCTKLYWSNTNGCPGNGDLDGDSRTCTLSEMQALSANYSGNVSIANTGGPGPGGQLFANQTAGDFHLTTNAAICNVRGGGLTIAGFTLDKDGLTRTTGNPSGGCVPANTGAAGWSMGAYESN